MSAGETQMGQGSNGIQHDYAMIGDFLELPCGLAAFMRREIRLAAQINGMQASGNSQLVRCGGLKGVYGFLSVVAAQGKLRVQSWQLCKLESYCLDNACSNHPPTPAPV
jgi:hypothetical protein